jgi:outer membrane protein assembly factor BamB
MCATAILLVLSYLAGDWPQFLGPHRNGASDERIANDWSKESPKIVWRKPVGSGFAGPIVVQDQVILFHRRENTEILEAFDARTGAPKWQNKGGTGYRDDFGFDNGPRAVPTFHEGRVYAMGAEGSIRCVEASDGKTIWSVAAKDEFKARKGFFGMACAPLIAGDKVVLNIGGEPGAGLIALDRNTGKLHWKSRTDEASYSSPVNASLGGANRIVAFTREAVCVLDPETGRQLAEYPWKARMHASVNAATPLVDGNLIFVTASYGTGALLLEWKGGTLEKVWSNDESLSSHYSTPVMHDRFLYGFHGRQEYGQSLRCVDLQNGKVKWSHEGSGAGTVTLAGDNLLVLGESGELALIKASPDKFQQSGSNTQVLGSDTRAYPALSEKRLFARGKNSLVCIVLP